MPEGQQGRESGEMVGQAGERRPLERRGKCATGAGVAKGQSGVLTTEGAATANGVTRHLNLATTCCTNESSS